MLATPLVRKLKAINPEAQIDFLVKEKYEAAVKHNPNIKNVFLFEKNSAEVLANKYNTVIDLQNNLRSGKFYSVSEGSVAKFKKKSVRKFLLVNFKLNFMKAKEKIPVRYAASIPIELDEEGLEFFFPPNFNLPEKQKKLVGFCPGSRHFTKRYPPDYFIELGELLNKNGFEVALIGGKEDKVLCEAIQLKLSFAKSFISNDNLFETAAAISRCSLVVCNDSGLMHLASALNTPLVAIYGSTVEEFGFFPYNCRSIIMENRNLNCRPCSHIGKDRCPKNHFKCMQEILPQKVFENILKLERSL